MKGGSKDCGGTLCPAHLAGHETIHVALSCLKNGWGLGTRLLGMIIYHPSRPDVTRARYVRVYGTLLVAR